MNNKPKASAFFKFINYKFGEKKKHMNNKPKVVVKVKEKVALYQKVAVIVGAISAFLVGVALLTLGFNQPMNAKIQNQTAVSTPPSLPLEQKTSALFCI